MKKTAQEYYEAAAAAHTEVSETLFALAQLLDGSEALTLDEKARCGIAHILRHCHDLSDRMYPRELVLCGREKVRLFN